MTVPEILEKLANHRGTFPLAAVEAAIEQREAITPELLRILETMADAPAESSGSPDHPPFLLASYLLAQFREQAAYPLLVRMVGVPSEIAGVLLNDLFTDSLGRLLGTVFDGRLDLLQDLVEDPGVDEYVRGAAVEAFVVLVNEGRISRELAVRYWRHLFQGGLEQKPSFAWDALCQVVADLPAPELAGEMRRAVLAGWTDSAIATLEDLEADLANPQRSERARYALIGHITDEIAWWPSFEPLEDAPLGEDGCRVLRPGYETGEPPDFMSPEPFVRPEKTGRNDPCPCGSGKEYKKCCG
ncbi:MAG: DUF1186 domain-containing protein, partial [Verrucomicrobiota bacterium]